MILIVALSGIFFLSIVYIAASAVLKPKQELSAAAFLPKNRTEMIRGIAAIAIVFSHIASYSKGAAPSGLLRAYIIFLTSLGGIGVDLFFFFSGYGNYFSVFRNKDHRFKWLWKRCATLLIVYIVCLVLVLAVLFAGGYRTSAINIFNEIIHLTIPYSSVWYVKIQLLVYVFLVVASFMKDRRGQFIIVTLLCFLSSAILFYIGFEDKWWKSTLCFAVGVFVGAYRSEIEKYIVQHKKALLTVSVLGTPFVYYGAIFVHAYPIKTIGHIILCIFIIAIAQLIQMDSSFYYKLGSYSLALYLIHRSFVAWILDDGTVTTGRIAAIVILSIIFTIAAKWISDRIVKRSF